MNKPIRTHDHQHEHPAPTMATTNGSDDGLLPALPEDRAAVVQYGLLKFQQMATERDNFEREIAALKTEAAVRQVELEAMQSRLADMESRVQTAVLNRDQAVAERAIYEALFISFQAQLRAFKVPAAPLVVASDETEADTEAE